MLEKFSSLDYKFQAALQLFESALSFGTSKEIKQNIVRKTMHYLNKKYLHGGYCLPIEECDNDEIVKNASMATLENARELFLAYKKNHNVTLSNSKARMLFNSSDPEAQTWLEFLDALDEHYLAFQYAELTLINNTEKDRAELKKELLEKGLEKFLPLDLPSIVDSFLEEIMDILSTKSYQMAKEKGFHSNEEKELDPNNMINSLAKHGMNLIGEVVELWEAARKGKLEESCDKSKELSNFDEELADAQIRLWDTAKTFGRDLGRSVRLKWEINKNRPHRNGGKLA